MERISRFLIAGAAAAIAFQAPAMAAEVEVKGIVVTNENGQLTIKTPNGDQTIALPANTRVRSISGVLGGQKEVVSTNALLPGLPVTITADDSAGHLVATEVDYKASDYKTAAQIQAGVQETKRREAELRSAYSRMGDWDIRKEETVYFKVGSSTIASSDREKLMAVATEAKKYKGYVVSVLGYADPTGNAAANERLSNRRAQNVINYLKQSGHLLPGRVLSASAMGEMNIPTAASDSAEYASARRVTVRVLTSAAQLNK